MNRQKALLLAAALAAAGSAHALDTGIGLRLGTTGLGADVGFGVRENITLRVGYSGLSVSRELNEDDITYEGNVKLSNLSALVDWRFAGQLRLTAGIISAKNTAEVLGRPTGGTFVVNDVTYTAAEVGTLRGNVRLGKSATPYLGIGYGDIARKGLSFYMDLGVMFQNSPTVDLSVQCGSISAARCTQLQNDVEAEEAQLRDDLKKFKYYPVLNLGIAYGW